MTFYYQLTPGSPSHKKYKKMWMKTPYQNKQFVTDSDKVWEESKNNVSIVKQPFKSKLNNTEFQWIKNKAVVVL